MTGPAPENDIPSDFTSQISEALKPGQACIVSSGSFGVVYQCTIEGTMEVAVKVFKIDPGRAVEKCEKAIRRELKVWLRLSKHPTIVPLLGIAYVGSSFPALISQWMPSGTLYMYLEQGTITDSAKVELVIGVADGLEYLHSEDVVHGDLHPANVLVDGSGHPRLTDFGLATVAGDGELQLSMTTAGRSFNPRWRAPEVIGIDPEDTPVRPNFKSDVYSFGCVMFFIVSGDIPWKEKTQQHHIIIELWKRATPARLNNILNDHWNLIQKCWSWDPASRPDATEVIRSMTTKNITMFRMTEMTESTIRTPPEMAESTIRTTPPEMAESTIRATPPEMSESTISTIPPELAESMSDTTGSQLQVVENHNLSKSVDQTLQLGNIQSITPGVASETKHDTTLSSDTTGLERRLNRSTPRSHETIIVSRETGAGKSSPVNLMAGKVVASIYALEDDAVNDLRLQISKPEYPIILGSFSRVYRCTIGASEEVAVKVIVIDHNRAMARIEKAMYRELRVWLKLRHLNIVPLRGIANVEPPLPALIYPWMPCGTLFTYLEEHATTLSASMKVGLAKGVADGLDYLHRNDVVHGDLQPANVLIDGSGIPCLKGFGLATVAGDPELQWTAGCDFDSRWRAPEIIGIERDEPERPTFASDVYSFGSVMFFIISGDIPWKEKKNSDHIDIELFKGGTPACPENILDGYWGLIQCCWYRNPVDRPSIDDVKRFLLEPTTLPISTGSVDLTGQIFGTIGDCVAGGTFGNIYRCEWRQPHDPPVQVAVKALRFHTSEQDLRRFRREARIWAQLVQNNIVTLYGTTEGFGPSTALVSPWFPNGNLLHMIAAQGAGLNIRSKLKLLHDIASGLDYLHRFPVVHGDISSSNVLVDVKDGEYKACLTDFGLSTVLGGLSDDFANEGSNIRWPGAIRWTAPELLTLYDHPADLKPATKHDMYSFGRVMYHVLTLVIPWHDIDEFEVVQKILQREDISRPEISDVTSDITDTRWGQIEQCWSVDPSARPSASMALDFLKSELEASKQDNVLVGGVQESHPGAYLVAERVTVSVPPRAQFTRQEEIGLNSMASQSQPEARPSPTPTKSQTLRSMVSQSQPKAGSSPTPAKGRSLPKAGSSPTPAKSWTMRNVVIIGQYGVGKSSLINMLCPEAQAPTSNDTTGCTKQEQQYECDLGGQCCALHDTIGLEDRLMDFLWAPEVEKRLRRYLKVIRPHLVVYCMPGNVAFLKKSHGRNFNKFKSVVGWVPTVVVVTNLENSRNPRDWWSANLDILRKLDIPESTQHACITTLPRVHIGPVLYNSSREAVKALIRNNLPSY